MYSDHRLRFWPARTTINEPLYSYNIDDPFEPIGTGGCFSTRPYHRPHLLASDIYCYSHKYKPIASRTTMSIGYRSYDPYLSSTVRPMLPRPISPIEFPRLDLDLYRPPSICKACHHHDFSYLDSFNREPSFFPLAHSYYRLQTSYETYHTNKFRLPRRTNLRQRWRAYGFILIFYFMLRRNLRKAKQKDTYYLRDHRRIRFLELLTAVHRIYLEPNSTIYNSLSYVVCHSSKVLNEEKLFYCVRTIINGITEFLPRYGILGISSEESVLVFLLNCTLDQYPSTYFWSIERHLLALSYKKMKQRRRAHLDHFTTKFILISAFIFRCLIKTLLLKPVKYRLIRGQLSRNQWLNTRALSTLILYVARHAVLYKENSHLPMPFPFEMKSYLFDDEQTRRLYKNVDQLVATTTPKLSSWACEYAEQLQHYISRKDNRS